MFCVAYCDSAQFKKLIEFYCDNLFYKFILKIIKSGITPSYKIRAQILYKEWEHISLPKGIVLIDGQGTIFNIVPKILKTVQMEENLGKCQQCDINYTKNLHYLSMELNDLRQLKEKCKNYTLTRSAITCKLCSAACIVENIVLNKTFIIYRTGKYPKFIAGSY